MGRIEKNKWETKMEKWSFSNTLFVLKNNLESFSKFWKQLNESFTEKKTDDSEQ